MQAFRVTVFLLTVVVWVKSSNEVERPKRAYTMVDYICHKQPYLSICTKRSLRALPPSNNSVHADPYDPDPMPTPGPLPLDDQKSAYDVARRREQEEPSDTDKRVNEEKPIRTRVKEPIEDGDMLTEEPTTETTTPLPEQDQTTVHPVNPRLRYQQYEKALQEYYRKYPYHQQYSSQQRQHYYYPSQQQYYQNQQQYYQNQNQQQQYYYPSQQQYYQNQNQQQQYYYPQQYYQNQQQPNYYQPNGFNFGIGSQVQIPFAGPFGISTGFGFGGK